MRKLVVALIFVTLVIAAIMVALAITATPGPLPSGAQAMLEAFLGHQDYAITSVQQATQPENFAAVCSFYTSGSSALWCVTLDRGHDLFSHFVLHQEEADLRWSAIPFYDFDHEVFEAIGCDNW